MLAGRTTGGPTSERAAPSEVRVAAKQLASGRVRLGANLGELRLHALSRDDVALPRMAFGRVLERGERLVGLPDEQEHLAEVGVRVSLLVEQVGLLARRMGIAFTSLRDCNWELPCLVARAEERGAEIDLKRT